MIQFVTYFTRRQVRDMHDRKVGLVGSYSALDEPQPGLSKKSLIGRAQVKKTLIGRAQVKKTSIGRAQVKKTLIGRAQVKKFNRPGPSKKNLIDQVRVKKV